MDCSKLTEADLCEGFAINCEALASIARRRAVIEGGHAGAADPERRAELVAELDREWTRLKREFDAYSSELERRGFGCGR
jgi:hypothetical protein